MARTFIVGILFVAMASVAVAGERSEPANQAERVLARLDTDRDGRLSAKEAEPAAKLARHFWRIDADRDGYVTREELSTALARLRARRDGAE